jgi:hypothetical protein
MIRLARTLLFVIGAAALPAFAAEQVKLPAYIDVASAPADFKVQGEYLGQVGDKPLGAQVVALGDGVFRAVLLPGGLPGEGWDGKTRVELKGRGEGAQADFPGEQGYSASIANETLTGKSGKDEKFTLKKVLRKSPAEGAKAPAGAMVLFDGAAGEGLENAKVSDQKLLQPGGVTKQKYQDFVMHVEFMLPYKPLGRGQDRGNSGLYIQRRYEVQILDSFGEAPTFNGCGSLYRQVAPSMNMSYPPLSWQTYDIDFTAPKFDEAGKKIKNGVITVKHNGVAIHDKLEIANKTGAGQAEGPTPGQILFQDHGNPVLFRNVWIVAR